MVGLPPRHDGAEVQKDDLGGLRTVLYVLIGIQASGKSTWAKANAGGLQAEVVASDEIRNELEDQGLAAEHEGDRVFSIFEARVARLLDEDRNVIADATHARRAWRANLLAIARQRAVPVVAVWFQVPLAASRARNALKPGGAKWGDRVVADEVLVEMWRRFEAPGAEEFDEIWKIG
jgi:predicted kinase